MDVRSGRIYPSMMEALGAGVPESDIAEILSDDDVPKVRFSSGPFKNRVYKRNPETRQLVRVGKELKKESRNG